MIDHAKMTEPEAGPRALAIEPKVIASPLTEAFLAEGTEALMSKKVDVNAMHDDILAQEEQNKTAANKGMPLHR